MISKSICGNFENLESAIIHLPVIYKFSNRKNFWPAAHSAPADCFQTISSQIPIGESDNESGLFMKIYYYHSEWWLSWLKCKRVEFQCFECLLGIICPFECLFGATPIAYMQRSWGPTRSCLVNWILYINLPLCIKDNSLRLCNIVKLVVSLFWISSSKINVYCVCG